eukprot:SAG11_NODE_2216_length_3680_cov_1.815415_2_plen_177_part_00
MRRPCCLGDAHRCWARCDGHCPTYRGGDPLFEAEASKLFEAEAKLDESAADDIWPRVHTPLALSDVSEAGDLARLVDDRVGWQDVVQPSFGDVRRDVGRWDELQLQKLFTLLVCRARARAPGSSAALGQSTSSIANAGIRSHRPHRRACWRSRAFHTCSAACLAPCQQSNPPDRRF